VTPLVTRGSMMVDDPVTCELFKPSPASYGEGIKTHAH
jgi:hypothetical protein